MILDLFNLDIGKILTLYSISPGSRYTRNELKEKTNLFNVSLDKSLSILLTNKILIKEKRFYAINFNNENAKIILNLIKLEYLKFKEIPLNVFYIIFELSYLFSKEKEIYNVFLFGSYSKLIYTEKSDIDIAIFLKNNNTKTIKKIKQKIKKIEKKSSKIIELHFYEQKDLNQNDKLIKEIKKNGVSFF
ncbi:hypothetical protein HOD20_02235 [archaeon]|jgi:predicted nucleotidyltransferase|nr:hypothetical protein [archaeon]MBT4351326.1 hypothetical protein [archaeon]MBT4647011.1 hypothetical protein [archaeon]MBT6822467.1 hypothetical protein [archaeon]MBT7391996.1 hypothetical protein [archaeon]